MLEKAKDMYALQKKARKIKKELKNTHIEAEVDGVVAVVDGEQEVVSINIPDSALDNSKKLGEALVKCLNKGIKKSQQVAAEEMKDVMGNLGLPGM